MTEQLLIYIGYVDETGEPHFDFLEVKDCLATSDSANAETNTCLIIEKLKESGQQVEHACGFGSDGASVMTGAQNGVGARIQAVCRLLVRTHCINHRLALARGLKRLPMSLSAKNRSIPLSHVMNLCFARKKAGFYFDFFHSSRLILVSLLPYMCALSIY